LSRPSTEAGGAVQDVDARHKAGHDGVKKTDLTFVASSCRDDAVTFELEQTI
jgi:hypothetical protein